MSETRANCSILKLIGSEKQAAESPQSSSCFIAIMMSRTARYGSMAKVNTDEWKLHFHLRHHVVALLRHLLTLPLFWFLDIRSVTLDSLRDSFGMVPQDPALFNISIMENLRYARLDARDDEVKEACKAAAIHDKIEKFPNGYESTVGERGVKLSGGELQRVAIARAILRQPKIVLLDEATSMIDAETESTIQEAFKNLSASRTTFVIAHRK